jgi:hypothetical protein
MGECRDSPEGFLAAFDRPPAAPVRPLNVDVSTVTTAAALILGLGEPLDDIIHLDFQSSAAGRKHADLLTYYALVFAHYLVPVHTIVLLLRPEAVRPNLNGRIAYGPRPGRGSMEFTFEVVPLWRRPADELLAGELGVMPRAVLGRLPEGLSLEDGLAAVAQRMAERVTSEAPPERANKLLTEAYLLAGLRIRRDAAARIFRGIRVMHESDTYLAIIHEGQEKCARDDILIVGEERLVSPTESIREQLSAVTDLPRLKPMVRRAVKAASWEEILDTP